jgi:sarcosine oxidase gamma subunit
MSGPEQNYILMQVSSTKGSAPRLDLTLLVPGGHQLMISYVDVLGRYVAIHIHGARLHTEATHLFLSFFAHSLDLREKLSSGACFSSYGNH